MTIEKGMAWGKIAPTPFGVVTARDEEALARAVRDGASHVALLSGDLLRALGPTSTQRPIVVHEPSLQVPCDIMEITIDDRIRTTAVSTIRIGTTIRPRVWVSSGGFVGQLNIATRAHPNDGVIDALAFDANLRLRQTLAIRRRMRTGNHLPHPHLTIQRGSEYHWSGTTDRDRSPVLIDGRRFGRANCVTIVVRPDAFVLCVAHEPSR